MLRKVGLAVVAAALVLAVAPAASAKGPFQICGASACAVLAPEGQPPIRLFTVDPATPSASAPAPAPYFLIRFADQGSPLGYWIPSASMLRVQGQPWRWVAALPSEVALLGETTAGLQPLAPPARPTTFVGSYPVKRSTGYLRLLTMGTPMAQAPANTRWLDVWFMGARSSPWTDGTTSLQVSRRGGYLKRDGHVFRIPLAVAKRVRGRLPLS
jgi:hypothetical protein